MGQSQICELNSIKYLLKTFHLTSNSSNEQSNVRDRKCCIPTVRAVSRS